MTKPYIGVLTNWELVDSRLHGDFIGNDQPLFDNGERIVTSLVQGVYRVSGVLVAETKNSKYILWVDN